MDLCESHCEQIGAATACKAFGVSKASFYRRRLAMCNFNPKPPRRRPARSLTTVETATVLDTLHSSRFVDKAPAQVWAALLDEQKYHCSVRTMYRILAANQEVRERRNQLSHPQYTKPELLATAPNQVWSWDITKLKGPEKWSYFYLYVILDIFSRYVVGWMVADSEKSELATQLIGETCEKQKIKPNELTLHADRGSSMKSKLVALLLSDLGVTKTHSRPYVSDDNPFSESQFKTMKYRPEFPERFGSRQHSRTFCQTFFNWYNTEHYHSGIKLLTPEMVHYGSSIEIIEQRQKVLNMAYAANPERFVNKQPHLTGPPTAVWINPPEEKMLT
jgi:putative transposase